MARIVNHTERGWMNLGLVWGVRCTCAVHACLMILLRGIPLSHGGASRFELAPRVGVETGDPGVHIKGKLPRPAPEIPRTTPPPPKPPFA